MNYYEERLDRFGEGQRVVCHSRELDVMAGTVIGKTTRGYGDPQLQVMLDGAEKTVVFNAVDCALFDEAWYNEYQDNRAQVKALTTRMQQMRRQKFPPLEE